MRDKRFLRPWLTALVLLFVVGACAAPIGQAGGPRAGSSATARSQVSDSPAPSGTSIASAAPSAPAGSANPADQATYTAIEKQVQTLRDLKATQAVNPVLLDSAGVASYLSKINAAETNHTAIADESRLLVHMGMLPPGSNLEQLELALESDQVIGFYDPKSKGLYVLSQSGGVGAAEKITFAHEFTHALQDQHFGLDKLGTDAVDQGDRDLARTALPEGDATLAMTQWAARYMAPADLLSVANDPGSYQQLQQLQQSPPILRQDLMFPYQQGLAFVQQVYASGGWAAVDKLYATPPDSTSQILHPEQYLNRVRPVALEVPQIIGLLDWKLTMQDTFGEFQLGIWLAGLTERNARTDHAVTQWAGDRIGLYEGPNGAWAVVVNTIWRTQQGADDFDAAAKTLVSQMGGVQARVCATATSTGMHPQSEQVILASDAAALDKLAPCQG
jgi:hypothetical protein